MKLATLLTILLAIGLSPDYPSGSTSRPSDTNDSIFQSYGFPSHPNLTHLCSQRVYGSGKEISWDAFASYSRPSKLVDYYTRKIGHAGLTKDGKGGVWRLPADAPRPGRVLEIVPVGKDNPSSACRKSPPRNSRAIIIISRMS